MVLLLLVEFDIYLDTLVMIHIYVHFVQRNSFFRIYRDCLSQITYFRYWNFTRGIYLHFIFAMVVVILNIPLFNTHRTYTDLQYTKFAISDSTLFPDNHPKSCARLYNISPGK